MGEIPCRGKTDVFLDTSNRPKKLLRLVQEYCVSCEYIEPCRKLSYQKSNMAGLWAGLSEKQRRWIRSFAIAEGVEPHEIPCVCAIGETSQCYLHTNYQSISKSRSR